MVARSSVKDGWCWDETSTKVTKVMSGRLMDETEHRLSVPCEQPEKDADDVPDRRSCRYDNADSINIPPKCFLVGVVLVHATILLCLQQLPMSVDCREAGQEPNADAKQNDKRQ
jgi:hypothetical protein